jgi:dihydroorotate dehydrogenase
MGKVEDRKFTILHTEWSEGWGGQEIRILLEMKEHRKQGHGVYLLCPPRTKLAEEAGGLSGRPLRPRALAVLRRLRATAGPALPLIGVGGIDSPESAWERITAGASLVQVYTGWIYEGPALVPTILEGLVGQLERHGLATIGEAVGSGLPWR